MIEDEDPPELPPEPEAEPEDQRISKVVQILPNTEGAYKPVFARKKRGA